MSQSKAAPGLMPEFVKEPYHAVNAGARTIRKTSEGLEKTVIGVDEISSIMLRRQWERLLAELELEPETILITE